MIEVFRFVPEVDDVREEYNGQSVAQVQSADCALSLRCSSRGYVQNQVRKSWQHRRGLEPPRSGLVHCTVRKLLRRRTEWQQTMRVRRP